MASGDKHSKTEKPTAKKKKDARQRGQVAKSRDIPMWLAVMAGTFVVPSVFHRATTSLRQFWVEKVPAAIARPDPATDIRLLGQGLSTVLVVVAPILGTMVVLAVVANVVQTGGAINRKALKPNFGRLNPLKGIKNLLSPTGLMNALKSMVKIAILGVIAWQMFHRLAAVIAGPSPIATVSIAALVAQRALSFIRTVAAIGIALGIVDYAFQRRRISKSLMMTKQEVKEEMKMSEGDPLIKGAIRRRQIKMSRLRMMAEVAHADAVIVNPTHVSVAIRYEVGKGAPRVVAKGTDDVALAIREEATAHGVPLVEDVPLARTLWQVCEIGDEIPADLYEAVARVLAFLFRVKASGRRPLGGRPLRLPQPPARPARVQLLR